MPWTTDHHPLLPQRCKSMACRGNDVRFWRAGWHCPIRVYVRSSTPPPDPVPDPPPSAIHTSPSQKTRPCTLSVCTCQSKHFMVNNVSQAFQRAKDLQERIWSSLQQQTNMNQVNLHGLKRYCKPTLSDFKFFHFNQETLKYNHSQYIL